MMIPEVQFLAPLETTDGEQPAQRMGVLIAQSPCSDHAAKINARRQKCAARAEGRLLASRRSMGVRTKHFLLWRIFDGEFYFTSPVFRRAGNTTTLEPREGSSWPPPHRAAAATVVVVVVVVVGCCCCCCCWWWCCCAVSVAVVAVVAAAAVVVAVAVVAAAASAAVVAAVVAACCVLQERVPTSWTSSVTL